MNLRRALIKAAQSELLILPARDVPDLAQIEGDVLRYDEDAPRDDVALAVERVIRQQAA